MEGGDETNVSMLPKAEIQITETLPETEVHLKRAALYLDTALFK